ncbi:MAG: hypothetical protein R3183_10090 [Oleiphilaceae bacterium]|nr:hypothetical protein [Oleiphilaceae bacterium]
MRIIKTGYVKTYGGIFLLAGLTVLALQNEHLLDGNEQHPLPVSIDAAHQKAAAQTNDKTPADSHEHSQHDQELAQETNDPFEGKEVKYRFQQVAAQFAEDIKYPNFSKPIRNEEELAKYLPNRSISSSMAINLDDATAAPLENSPQISLQASKYRYYQGEPLLAEAEITGLSEGDFVGLSAYVLAERKVIANALEITRAESERAPNSQHFTISFDDLSHLASGHNGDMRIVAEFTVGGQPFAISAPVQYPNTIATLEQVGLAKVDAEYLVIPVHISTTSPGLHSVKANLYDAESGVPIAHLNGRNRITSSTGVIHLKAHIVTLKKMGYEGPYELKDIALSRGPSAPRNITERGMVPRDSYAVAGFPFSQYEDIPYVDERAQARLDFLTQLGRAN